MPSPLSKDTFVPDLRTPLWSV